MGGLFTVYCILYIIEKKGAAGKDAALFVYPQILKISPLIATILKRAEVAEWQTRYVQGVVFERAWEFKSPPRHQITKGACSSVGLERSPAEAQVVGSSPTKRATRAVSSAG
jgi:hypothetical protein